MDDAAASFMVSVGQAVELARRTWVWAPLCVALALCFTIGAIAIPLLVIAIAIPWLAASTEPVRRSLDEDLRWRRRLARCDARERRLEDAGVSGAELRALTALVDRLMLRDARQAELLDLEGLLDHATTVILALARHRDATNARHGRALARSVRHQPPACSVRHQLLERRLERWGYCRERTRQLEAELAGIEDLLERLLSDVRCSRSARERA